MTFFATILPTPAWWDCEPASRRSSAGRRRRRRPVVAVVVYDGITPFELGVACDVFGAEWEGACSTPPGTGCSSAPSSPGPVSVEGGFQMVAAHGPDRISSADTVIVLPTIGWSIRAPPEMPELLQRAHARGARIVSLCTGAFVLAAAGLLDGRRATTHWSECRQLASRYPRVTVDPGVLFVDEGDILTSAGSAASIDLCLHLVRHDYGSEIATQLARQLVVPPQRDGGQAQYIAAPLPPLDDSNLFADTVSWMQEHLDQPITVDDLAAPGRHEPAQLRPTFPSRHRDHPLPVAAPAASPTGPTPPRDHRLGGRLRRRAQRIFDRRQPAQALPTKRAHQPPVVPAHVSDPTSQLIRVGPEKQAAPPRLILEGAARNLLLPAGARRSSSAAPSRPSVRRRPSPSSAVWPVNLSPDIPRPERSVRR